MDSADIVACDVPEYMYQTFSSPLAPLFAHLDASSDTDRLPIVLFYPRFEEETTLLHLSFIHELGHAAATKYGLVDRIVSSEDGRALIGDVKTKHFHSLAGDGLQDAGRMFDDRISDWVEEAVCDALAIRYAGPSYSLAFSAFVFSMNRAASQKQHPPATLRLRLMVRQLSKYEWTSVVRDDLPEIHSWFSKLTGVEPTFRDVVESALCEALAALGPLVERTARERLSDRRAFFSPRLWAHQETEI